MSKKLHVVSMPAGSGQRFDASFGVLVLQQAGDFRVVVKEFRAEIDKIDGQIKAKVEEDNEQRAKYLALYEKKAQGGWTAAEIASEAANSRLRDDTRAKNQASIDALNKKKYDVLAAFKDVKWCWQLVGEGLTGQKLDHNQSFAQGVSPSYDTVHFPKLLEGGGLAWLEVFRDGDPATGKLPEGFYVQAIGTPKVIRTEWTDHECNPIKGPVRFGSEVLLNVYTAGMYGHEIRIQLIDEDYWFFDSDDTLPFNPGSDFTAEVDIHPVHPSEIGKQGVGGLLTKDEAAPKGKAQTEQFIQKSVIRLLVNPAWKSSAGSNLKIYPTVKSVKTDKFFEGFERTYLEVTEDAKLYDDPSAEYPITPTFIGEVATDVGAFHPCKYDEIKFSPIPETEKQKARVVFNKEKAQTPLIHIPIICADVDHMTDYSLKLIGLETKECRLANSGNSHTGKSLPVKKTPENFKVVSNDGTELKFKAAFSYHPSSESIAGRTSYGILRYIWPASLPANNNTPLVIGAETCRYVKPINVLAYPDVKWTLDFRFGMKGPEQFTHTGLPGERRHDPTTGKPDNRFNKAQQKAVKAGRVSTFGMNKKADGMELEFQLVLKAEYNKGEELELAEKYAEKIKKFLGLLLKLKDGLDTLTNIDKVNAGHKGLVKSLSGKLLKAPIIGNLEYPAISIGAKWQAAVNDVSNEVYTDGKLILRFNPLLKGDVSLDIIAAATYVPAWGQVIRGLELALNTVGAELSFLLTMFGQVNVAAEYALAEKGGSNLNVDGELGIKLVLSGKIKITKVIVWEVNDAELSAEGYAVTSIKPKASIGHDNKGTFVEAKCDFMGVNVVVIGTAKWGKSSRQYKDTFNILERQDDFVNGRAYIIS